MSINCIMFVNGLVCTYIIIGVHHRGKENLYGQRKSHQFSRRGFKSLRKLHSSVILNKD